MTQFNHLPPLQYAELKSRTGKRGRWYSTPIGDLPSITTILGDKENTALSSWKQSMGKTKAEKEMKRCADRGSAIHLMAEHYLNNQAYDTSDTNLVRLFNKLKLSLNKINNIRAQEVPMFSEELLIAGRVDCVAEYNGQLSIIDFKTSNNFKTEDMVHDYFLQCTAYAIMYYEMFGEPITNIVVLMTPEKGLPIVYKKHINNYIKPLQRRIVDFYIAHGDK